MIYALFCLSAHATTYSATDVLRAQLSGMPAGIVGSIAGQVPAASVAEKSCLVALGVPAAVVATMPGAAVAAGTPTPGVEECRKLGLDGAMLGVELEQARANAAAREAADAARRAAAARKPECASIPGGSAAQVDEAPARIQAWLSTQLHEGRSEFFVVPFTTMMSFQGSGGGGTVAVVCAWAEGD